MNRLKQTEQINKHTYCSVAATIFMPWTSSEEERHDDSSFQLRQSGIYPGTLLLTLIGVRGHIDWRSQFFYCCLLTLGCLLGFF